MRNQLTKEGASAAAGRVGKLTPLVRPAARSGLHQPTKLEHYCNVAAPARRWMAQSSDGLLGGKEMQGSADTEALNVDLNLVRPLGFESRSDLDVASSAR